jgi:hypothetical protein
MCPAIDNSASFAIHAVIRFLHNTKLIAAEIRRELCAVYSKNVMSEGTLRQWCRMFTMKSEVVGWPSVVSHDLVQSVDKIFVKGVASQCLYLHVSFHKFQALFSTKLSQLD